MKAADSKYKYFDKDLFNKNDRVARELVKKFLSKKYPSIEDAEDKFGPDLVVKGLFWAECEIKQNWGSVNFPFSTVNIPSRKGKYLKKGRVLFFIISKNLKRAVVVDSKHVLDDCLQEVPNKYVALGELFYQIPLNLCRIVDLEKREVKVS